MLRCLKDLEQYTMCTTDGEIGTMENVLLDDATWTVRHLVVDIGDHCEGRQVRISPSALGKIDQLARRFHLALTMDETRKSPSNGVGLSVSPRRERNYQDYYGFPYYSGYSMPVAQETCPNSMTLGTWFESSPARRMDTNDVHLRSAKEVRGYRIQGSDGPIGRFSDFIADDQTWEVRYLVIDTSRFCFGKQVLVAPRWVTHVSWQERNVYVNLPRKVIKNSPEWTPTSAIERAYEEHLHNHFGRPMYRDDGERRVHIPVPIAQR